MSEKQAYSPSNELSGYAFSYIFPNETISTTLSTFRETAIDAEDFAYIPELYADRVGDNTRQLIAQQIERIDGKSIGEIQQAAPTILSEYCEGFPDATPEQLQRFEQDLGPIVSAFHHGSHTAEVMLEWLSQNADFDSSSSVYERDLLLATALFHDASDIILGVPKADELRDVTDDMRARVVRELLYAAFIDHEQEAHLISSTMLTGDYCDPFHHAIDQTIRSHEQFFAATTLDYVKTGARAFEKSTTRLIEGDIAQSDRYRTLAGTIARVAVPALVFVERKYPAITGTLNEQLMHDYLNEYYYLNRRK